jgi:hypothetical protein
MGFHYVDLGEHKLVWIWARQISVCYLFHHLILERQLSFRAGISW